MKGSLVTALLSYDQLHDLWGAGYTIVARNKDPFEIDPKLVPKDRSYQWMHLEQDKFHFADHEGKLTRGWARVPYARHEGVFAPWGTPGDIERSGLALFEKPKFEVEEERAHARKLAEQQVTGWAKKFAGEGITGTVRIATQTQLGKLDSDEMRPIGEAVYANPSTKTLETTVKIPKDMIPHMAAIFAERDRLEAEVVRKDRSLMPGPISDQFYKEIDANRAAPWWPTLRAILLPLAIENVRANLKKDTPDE